MTHRIPGSGDQAHVPTHDRRAAQDPVPHPDYPAPTGDRVGLSFTTPRSRQDLERRHTMMRHWARASCGMMGRTPDFLNASLMAMAAAGDYFGQNRPAFKQNIQRYYEYIREHDLVL